MEWDRNGRDVVECVILSYYFFFFQSHYLPKHRIGIVQSYVALSTGNTIINQIQSNPIS